MNEALQTGLYLTIMGMSLVFFVLAMLWGLIALLLKLDKEPEPETAVRRDETLSSPEEGLRPDLVAVIATAVQAYRAEKSFGGVTHTATSPMQEEVDYWSLAGRVQQQRVWRPGRRN
ncbi:MAG TPA: OadG family protein [Caldilineae bacterium]|nr:OadG family protein [Caldilineae bacterium]